MDEKTEELRDLFLDVTDEESVTETQTDERGSLGDEQDDIEPLVRTMRDRFEFRTDLDVDRLCALVGLFYDGTADEQIATELDVTESDVFDARMDLHLLREDDAAGVDLDALRECLDGGDLDDAAAALDEDPDRLRRASRVLQARNRARRTSYRFQTAFEARLTDADVSGQMAAEAREDGLEEATDDADVDVDF